MKKGVNINMLINKRFAIFITYILITGLLSACSGQKVETQQPVQTPTVQSFFVADKGPAAIDISKYPKNKQQSYKLFETHCSKCHSLARALNANIFGESNWGTVVHKMATRPGSDVKPEEEKQILDFIVYDHEQRKTEIERFWAFQPK